MMKYGRLGFALTVIGVVILLFVPAADAAAIEELRTFYFGNSFTGNTMPGLHPLLGESAAKQWTVSALIHPDVPIWLHMQKQMDKTSSNYQKFHSDGPETDAIVMLLFGGYGLSSVVTEKWQGKVNDTIWEFVKNHPYTAMTCQR
jgi:hypothetical protein